MKRTRPEQWYQWQLDGFDKYATAVANRKQDFLAAVSGGGGKTFWALENARRMLAAGEIDRVIVVTYTSHLVRQWDEAASALGISLLAVAGNGKLKSGLPADVQGYICTYAALGRMPDLHETYANECRTLVIFDEIHHLGDVDEKTKQSKWGEGAKIAFRSVAWRLSLSGTPFRSNASRIPFVQYVPLNGSNTVSEAIFDHTYSYGMAVRDGVCRRVVFHDSDGPIEWRRGDLNGTTLRHRFDDTLEPAYHNDRLRFAVCAETDGNKKNLLLQEMLIRANNRLNDIRKAGDSDAGGLIVADRIQQARDIKEMLQRLTGVRAVIVHNEEERALAQIDDFRNGVAPWIISVKMITEGVDIPRLRVCVYAAVVADSAELFLSQIIFRIVRKPPKAVGESYFFYPADQRLKDIVAKIEAEMQARIDERERETREGGEAPERVAKAFVGAEYETSGATIAGQSYADADIIKAEEFRKQAGDSLRDIPILDLVKFYYQYGKYDQAKREPPPAAPEESYNEKRERLRRELKNLVGRLFYKQNRPHNIIHNALNDEVGIPDTESATNEQLERKANIAREWLDAYDLGPLLDLADQEQDDDDAEE